MPDIAFEPADWRRLRRALLAIVVFGIAAGVHSSALPQDASSAPTSEEQRVIAVEDEYVVAEVDRDEDTLRRLIDERFVLNSSDASTFRPF